MTFSSFFCTLCSNRLFPKKSLKFYWKNIWKGAAYSSPVKYKTIDWYWRLVNPKLEKKVTPSETRQKLKRDVFSLRGQKWILYSFEQSKLRPSFWISLIRKNFARKISFSKDKIHSNNGNYDVFQFFWYPMLESTVSKICLKFSLKKLIEKGAALSSPVKYNTIDWYWRLVNPKLEKKITPSETRQKLKRDVFSLGGQKWILYSFEQSRLTPSFWISLIRKNFARKISFSKDKIHSNNGNYDVFQFFWYPMLESTVSKICLKFSLKKLIEKGAALSSPVKYNTIDWYWRLVNPKLEKKITPSETRQKLKRDVFSLGGQKWILYSFEQSRLTPSFWISLIRKNFARKISFSKDKIHSNNGNYDVFQFFWYTMLESTVSKKKFKFFVEKTFEKTQHFLRLWNIRQSIDIEDW